MNQLKDKEPAPMMVNARHVTHSYIAQRIEKIRKLITALRSRQLMREDIGELLQLGPSGVRKYVKELSEAGVIEVARYVDGSKGFIGFPVYRLALDDDTVDDYLSGLAARGQARPVSDPGCALAMAGEGRRFHILADDKRHAIRVNRAPTVRDPLVTALFGPRARPELSASAS